MPETVRVSEDLADLIPLFLAKRREDAAAWAAALARKDAEALGAIGHRLKGTCPSFGFMTLGEMGRELEGLAQAGALDRATALLDDFRRYVASVQIVVTAD
jgi:HPt (histidine-containing phosphotransfer) domain-containing protein